MISRLDRLKRRFWPLEADHPSPTVININTFRNLGQFLAQATTYAPCVHSTHLKRNQLPHSFVFVLQEPVSVFLSLHAANHAPSPHLVSHGKRNCLRTILSDSIVIVLFGCGKVGSRPR
jgi:hypothetical protein